MRKFITLLAILSVALVGCEPTEQESNTVKAITDDAVAQYVADIYPGWSIVGQNFDVSSPSSAYADILIRSITGEEKIIFLFCSGNECRARHNEPY